MTNRTTNANLAPRCQHTKLNGSPCAAPARRARKYCVFHEAAHAKRPDYAVRLVEDAMSLQLALYQVMRALDDHALDPKRAALKLYALQIAASNLNRLHQETQEIAKSDDLADQKSMLKAMLEQLHCPEEDMQQQEPSAPTFTIQACAAEDSAIAADATFPLTNAGLRTTGYGRSARHHRLPVVTETETVLTETFRKT